MKRITLLLLLAFAMLAACRSRGPAQLVFTPDALPPAQLGQPYQAVITVSENVTPVFYMGTKEGRLPAGLTFIQYDGEAGDGEISGVPEERGVFEFTIEALCYGTNVTGQSGVKQYRLVVE